MSLVLIVILCAVAALGAYVLLAARRERAVPAPSSEAADENVDVLAALTADREISAPVTIAWPQHFAARSGALDDDARLQLIDDLGLVRSAWCVPLLIRAYDEEPEAGHRRAALTALAACGHPDARPTFERALQSTDDRERTIAEAALKLTPA